jgi:methionyl-tRNA synthetase
MSSTLPCEYCGFQKWVGSHCDRCDRLISHKEELLEDELMIVRTMIEEWLDKKYGRNDSWRGVKRG